VSVGGRRARDRRRRGPAGIARKTTPRARPFVVAGALLLLAGCERPPVERLPAGTLWSGDARAARTLLQPLLDLEGTPAALAGGPLLARLASCQRFLAFCPAGKPCTLAAAISCQPAGALWERAEAARGDAAWVFVQGDGARRLTAWGTTATDGETRIHAEIDAGGSLPRQPWEALLPARRAAAPAVLSDDHALVHLRLRSDRGIADLGAGVAAARAEELFGLRGELFAAMALEGTSELALYDPAPGQLIPPIALALPVRNRGAGVRALEDLIARTNTRWGATRTPWQLGPHRGACLSDLNVLPGLAPCYVATENALVLGWNRLSVTVALLTPPLQENTAEGADGSSLRLHLDRFPAADRRLREAWHSEGGPAPRYGWSRATVTGRKRSSRYELDLTLAPPRPALPPREATGAP
jgi:hypothetical protein